MWKVLFIFTFILFLSKFNYVTCYGQNNYGSCYDHFKRKPLHISVGLKKYGLGFGGFRSYNGINFGLIDKTCNLNGVGISLLGQLNTKKITNGIEIGLVHNVSAVNGIFIGSLIGLVNYDSHGIQFSGLVGDYGSVKGLNIVGGFNLVDEMNGVSLTGLHSNFSSHNGIGVSLLGQSFDHFANGVYIAGLINKSVKTNGLSISAINISTKGNGLQVGLFNHSSHFNGVQFGILNIIKENPFAFRALPFLNMNFSVNPILRVVKDSNIFYNQNKAMYVNEFYPGGKLKIEEISSLENTYLYLEYFENGNIKLIKEYNQDTLCKKYFHRNGNLHYEIMSLNDYELYYYWVYDRKGNVKDLRKPNSFYPKFRMQDILFIIESFKNFKINVNGNSISL